MNEPTATALDAARRKALEDRLGALLTWNVPELFPTAGPLELKPFHDYDRGRSEVIAVCTNFLAEATDAQIALLDDEAADDPEAFRDAWISLEDARIERLKTNVPPWFCGGFGHPDHSADYDHWCRMPTFSFAEALSLSLGVEPSSLPERKIRRFLEADASAAWPSVVFLQRRHELMRRQFDALLLDHAISAKRFLDWADRVDLEMPNAFLNGLRRFHRNETTSPRSSPDPREIDTICMLFTTMAIQELGYDPTAKTSPIPKEIASLASSLGLSMTPETVRKYLKRGAEKITRQARREQI